MRLLLAAALLLAQACAFAQGTSSSSPTGASGTNVALIRQSGTTLPATCAVGQLFFKTNATAGQNIYQCASANTWTQQGGGPARVTTAADAASITPNGATTDEVIQSNTQALGTLTLNAPTGTPVDGQKLIVRVTSTNAHTLSFNGAYTGSTDVALPTTLSGASKADYLGFIYNSASTKWNLVAKSFGY